MCIRDRYKLGTGGAAQSDKQIPNIANVAGKIKDEVIDKIPNVPFIEPSIGEAELNYNNARAVINANNT